MTTPLARIAGTITTPSPIAPLLMTDAYKLDHRRQYPEGTTRVYSNMTARGSRIEGIEGTVHFGLQAFLQAYCVEAFAPFFAAEEDEVADLYEAAVERILGPNDVGSDHIRALHRLGYLPLRFCAVPEGTIVPLRVPAFTIENTHPEFFWLTNYIETPLSASVWHPATSATIAHSYREVLDGAAFDTGGHPVDVDYQLHDFSYRGMTGTEAAAASGAGHLLSFRGSDSLASIDWIDRYYARDVHAGEPDSVLASVPATEHSVMCAGGEDDEFATYSRLLELYPTGIVSIVSDTWDLWNVITRILPALHEQIVARPFGKVVIRPDSGDPVDILTGSLRAGLGYTTDLRTNTVVDDRRTPAQKGVVELLWEEFGGSINGQGYKVLHPNIGVIYGDSITLERARQIISRLEEKGFASTNVVLGVGSYTYQYVTRDTFGSALKATWVEVDGVGRDIRKDPVTDNGLKRSAAGRLAVVERSGNELRLIEHANPEEEAASLLQPVWEDGQFVRYQSFDNVRAVLGAQL